MLHVPMSSLLTSVAAEELKTKAALVNDEEVMVVLLEALLRPECDARCPCAALTGAGTRLA